MKIISKVFLLGLFALSLVSLSWAQSSSVDGRFTLQVASLADEAAAEAAAQALRAKGLAVQWVRNETAQHGVRFRVQIGRYRTAAGANAAARQFQRKGAISEYFVARWVPAARASQTPTTAAKPDAPAAPQVMIEKEPLQAGMSREARLAGGQARRYTLKLTANQFARFQVEQRGVDVVLQLLDAKGKSLVLTDRPNGDKRAGRVVVAYDGGGNVYVRGQSE